MTKTRFKELREQLGLNVNEMAEFLSLDRKTASRYGTGTLSVPDAVAMLLAIMVRKKITPQQARGIAGLK